MPNFNVSPKKEAELLDRMRLLKVAESDLEETFVKSSGPGGQKVNKTSSCVLLRHIPTNLQVKCHKERSQSLNRFFARRLLLDEIERKQNGFVAKEQKQIDKIRSKKRKKAKSGRAKMEASKQSQPDKPESE